MVTFCHRRRKRGSRRGSDAFWTQRLLSFSKPEFARSVLPTYGRGASAPVGPCCEIPFASNIGFVNGTGLFSLRINDPRELPKPVCGVAFLVPRVAPTSKFICDRLLSRGSSDIFWRMNYRLSTKHSLITLNRRPSVADLT